MRRWSALAAAAVSLVAGCGAGASTSPTHAEALSVHRSLGCAPLANVIIFRAFGCDTPWFNEKLITFMSRRGSPRVPSWSSS